MKQLLLIAISFLIMTGIYGQKRELIKETGIKKIIINEQRLENGIDKKFIVKEESYNEQGLIVELKETSRKGEIKTWVKYTYNAQGKIIQETVLNNKGEISSRVVYHYERGLKTKKEYFDSRDRLYRIKTYEYEY